jgi:hypothetical protein
MNFTKWLNESFVDRLEEIIIQKIAEAIKTEDTQIIELSGERDTNQISSTTIGTASFDLDYYTGEEGEEYEIEFTITPVEKVMVHIGITFVEDFTSSSVEDFMELSEIGVANIFQYIEEISGNIYVEYSDEKTGWEWYQTDYFSYSVDEVIELGTQDDEDLRDFDLIFKNWYTELVNEKVFEIEQYEKAYIEELFQQWVDEYNN